MAPVYGLSAQSFRQTLPPMPPQRVISHSALIGTDSRSQQHTCAVTMLSLPRVRMAPHPLTNIPNPLCTEVHSRPRITLLETFRAPKPLRVIDALTKSRQRLDGRLSPIALPGDPHAKTHLRKISSAHHLLPPAMQSSPSRGIPSNLPAITSSPYGAQGFVHRLALRL